VVMISVKRRGSSTVELMALLHHRRQASVARRRLVMPWVGLRLQVMPWVVPPLREALS